MMHGQQNVKFCNAKQTTQIYTNTRIRISKQNCTRTMQPSGIIRHAESSSNLHTPRSPT